MIPAPAHDSYLIVYIWSGECCYKFDIPSNITKDNIGNMYFYLTEGSNVSVSLKTNVDGANEITTNFVADVPAWNYEYYDVESPVYTEITPSEIVYLMKPVSESFVLSGIKTHVNRTGVLTFLILRPPKCEIPTPFFDWYEWKCSATKGSIWKDIGKLNAFNFGKGNSTVACIILLMVNETGYQTIKTDKVLVKMGRGDILGLKITDTSAQISCQDMPGVFTFNYLNPNPLSLYPGDTVDHSIFTSPSTFCIPAVSYLVTKPFVYHYDPTINGGVGIMNFEASVTSPVCYNSPTIYENTEIPDTIGLVTGLRFVTGEPKSSNESCYDKDDAITTFITFSARVDTGRNNIIFRFNFTTINQIDDTKPTVNYTTVTLDKFSSGEHEVIVTALNGFNEPEERITFAVAKKVRIITAVANKTFVSVGEPFLLDVTVVNGDNASVTIDFGDGRFESVQVVNEKLQIVHSYTYCIDPTIRITAFNCLSQRTFELNMKVSCDLIGLTLTPFPIAATNEIVYLTRNYELQLDIMLESGNFVEFIIDWGDNETVINDQSHLASPTKFTTYKSYEQNGMYKVSVQAKALNQMKTTYLDLYVTDCAPPPVRIVFTTKSSPIVFVKSDIIEFKDGWDYPNGCEKKLEKDFNPKEYELFDKAEGSLIKQSLVKQNREIHLQLGKLADGCYSLHLTFTCQFEDSELVFIYKICLCVLELQLVADIANGIQQQVPCKTLNATGHQIPYKVMISGRQSFDPYTKKAGIDDSELEVEWKCRCINASSTWTSLTAQNPTKAFACLEETLINIDKASTIKGELEFNTDEFLPDFHYEFQIIIKKGGRSSMFNQIVEIVQQIAPQMTITCKNYNCNEYISTTERFQLQSVCIVCPEHLVIKGVWLVKKQDKATNNFVDANIPIDTEYDSPNLVVEKDKLTEGTVYLFILRVSYSGSKDYTEVMYKRTTSTKPQDGKCSVRPSNGIAGRTLFSMECKEWMDEGGGKLSYAFLYTKEKVAENILELKQLNTDPESTFVNKFSLPAGNEFDDYKMYFKIKISNRYGTYVIFDRLSVKVVPPVEPLWELCAREQVHKIDEVAAYIDVWYEQAESEVKLLMHAMRNTKIDPITKMEDKNWKQDLYEKSVNLTLNRRQCLLTSIEHLATFTTDAMTNGITYIFLSKLINTLTMRPSDITPFSMEKVVRLANFLCEHIKNIIIHIELSEEKQEAIITVLNVISNILELTFAFTESCYNETDIWILRENATSCQKIVETNNMCLACLNMAKFLLLENMILDQVATSVKLAGETLTCQKVQCANLHKTKIPEYELPPFSCKNGQSSAVDVTAISHEANPYPNDNTSTGVSDVKQLNLSFKVENLTVPIFITMKNGEVSSIDTRMKLPFQQYYSSIQVKPGCVMFFSIQLPQQIPNVTVYLQLNKVASKSDHDLKIEISDIDDLRITKASGVGIIKRKGVSHTLPRKVHIKQIDNKTMILWDFHEFTFAKHNKSSTPILHMTFLYEGDLPRNILSNDSYDAIVYEDQGIYSVSYKAFCSECKYRDKVKNDWSNEGLELSLNKSNATHTVCASTHLTAFGSFFVAPNPLPAFSLALLKEGFVLLVTVLVMLIFWIIGLIVARRIDKGDFSKIGVTPLPDNKPGDNYLYEITVNTGTKRKSGTKSNVCIVLSGSLGTSKIRRLADTKRTPFQTGSVDIFILATPKPLGDIQYIRIWHDNSAGPWYLRSIEVTDLQTEDKDMFLASRWLAVDKHDGMLDCVIHAASHKELTEFNYLFTSKTRRDFSDAHLWFSVYARPPRSPFTRCQRLSVAISLLFCSMIASVMFYDAVPQGKPEDENKVGGFSFNWKQVFVAIISACITIPINLILVFLFRSIKPNYLENVSKDTEAEKKNRDRAVSQTSLLNDSKDSVSINMQEEEFQEDVSKETQAKKKKPFYLPSWALYPTWLLCVLVILTCSFFIVWYGMAFGNVKSLDWLASISICLVQDILIMQPIKVFALALFIALIVKKLDDEEKSEMEKQAGALAKDESWLHKLADETTLFDRVETEDLHPPDLSKLGWMREIRLKEVQMYSITREIVLYLIFTGVVFMIGFFTRDPHAFLQHRDIEELLTLRVKDKSLMYTFDKVQSSADFWPWMDNLFLKEVFSDPWYKLDPWYDDYPDIRDFPGKVFLNDLNSKIVNGIRLRQVRVKPDTCSKADSVKDIIKLSCASEYSVTAEDTRDFNSNWSLPFTPNDEMDPINKPWRYQTWLELDGYPFWAELDTYFGGGYVVEIFPKWDNKAMLDLLKTNSWIDRYSRAIIIEFTLYNAATNYFNAMIIVFEFPPGGGVIPFYSINTFRLYRLTNESAMIVIACEVLFMLFMMLFTVREMKLIYKTRWNYFSEFWNLVELSNIFLTLAAIVFYIYRDILGKELLGKLPNKRPNNFINFQFAGFVDSCFTYIIALICFFVTLKFIKLLRFNRRISLLSYTLKRAWYPLSMFGISFGIIITATVISSSIIFGSNLYGYRDFFKTIASIIGLLLGKFKYDEFESGNRILGPFFFLFFNITVNWIIMNMMIAILTDVFAEVQEEILAQENDFEFVDFITGHFKDWLGLQNAKQETEKLLDEKMGENGDLTAEEAKKKAFGREMNEDERMRYEKPPSVVDFDDFDNEKSMKSGLNTDDDEKPQVSFNSQTKIHKFESKTLLESNDDDASIESLHSVDISVLNQLFVDDDMSKDNLFEEAEKFMSCMTLPLTNGTTAGH